MTTSAELLNKVQTKVVLKKITVNGFQIKYIESGRGKPIVLIHGANIGWGQWYKTLDAFSKNNKVYALDLPGAGESGGVDLRSSNLENLYLKTIEEFISTKKIKNITLIGHSVGAWIALKLALRLPKRIVRLILVDPVGFIDYMPIKFMPISFYPIASFFAKNVMGGSKSKVEKFLKDAFYKNNNIPREFLDYVAANVEEDNRRHPLFLVNKISSPRRVKKEFVLTHLLEDIKAPILIISGREDKVIPIKKLELALKKHKKIKLVIINEVGHVPPIESSDAFTQNALEFIRWN